MSDLVPPDKIEDLVGVARARGVHFGRAVSATQTVYVLHSQRCRDTGDDLRGCRFSRALDAGIDTARWEPYEDTPVVLAVDHGHLIPLMHASAVRGGQ